MSISQNFPDLTPSLNLNFAGSKKLDSRITFTRGSTGTYTDDNGIIRTAGINQPRFDHSYDGTTIESLGLLIEESRTNLLVRSEEFDNGWALAGASIGINSTTAPDGTSNADAALEDGANGQHTVYRDVTTSPSNTYTASCFIKAGTKTYAEIFINGGGSAGSGTVAGRFNLTNLTVTSTGNFTLQSSSITPYPNGWYRCSITGSVSGSGSIVRYHVRPSEASTGDYQGVNGAVGVYIWGAQLEAGSFPTSYIPTVASQVTRSADNASITGTNFSSWYNSNEGSVVTNVNTAPLYGPNAQVYCSISDGTENNRMVLYRPGTGADQFRSQIAVTVSSVQINLTSTIDDTLNSSKYKMGFAYKTNDMNAVFAGSVSSGITTSVPTSTQLNIGDRATGSRSLNGTISQISYYPKRLTNTQLQNLTR